MVFIIILGVVLFVALVFGPQAWVRSTLAAHAKERSDYPGTGGELAEHLIGELGLKDVKVERTDRGDHYNPEDRAGRLTEANLRGRSVTAAAVAAHEVSHALQHHEGYGPLMLRQKMIRKAAIIETVGTIMLAASPLVLLITRAPAVFFLEIAAGLAILASSVVIHVVTLPTELDASFKRALPILERYLPAQDMPAARSVLRAAAFTYVASALVTLLNVARWLRVLRF
ncbi:MAG: zinc metallopeptidase [Propylenella sp.]